ncbi:MAG: HAD-IA family hydrolase [Anaerolineales bacterium]|nr:HAD-IA family hydrolase [Anaerolineales bacterium]
MIQAWIFDLDGTLVKTERLKALSYAKAAVELCPYELAEEDVVEAFKEVVGRSRQEVAQSLVEKFDLGDAARKRMSEFGVTRPWQAFVQVRLKHYENMISDPNVIRSNQWPHNVDLLRQARQENCKTALVTMSACRQTASVLQILELEEAFDFIATRDDVQHGKPDPEIYQLALDELGVTGNVSLAIEDSPSGVESALAAGVNVVAVSTPFTRVALHKSGLLPTERIVDDPEDLPRILNCIMREVE